MHPQLEATMADLATARRVLWDALAGLSDAGMEGPLGPGEWRVRDMLAHIGHWNRWGLNRLRQLVRQGGPSTGGQAIDADAVNERIAQAWALQPLADVLAELESGYEDVMAFMRSLPPEWAERTWEHGGKAMTVGRWLGFAAEHEQAHAEQLRAWRASGGVSGSRLGEA